MIKKPTFPNPGFNEEYEVILRDYFAANAMQAVMNYREEQLFWGNNYSIEEMHIFTAERAYEQADAMMEARKE